MLRQTGEQRQVKITEVIDIRTPPATTMASLNLNRVMHFSALRARMLRW